MAKNVLMPQKGLTETSAILAEWHVETGDIVDIGTPLFDIETGKATFGVESDVKGSVLAKYGDVNDEIDVGAVVLIIGEKDEKIQEPKIASAPTKKPVSAEPEETSAPVSTQQVIKSDEKEHERIFASPLARKLAKDNGIELSEVTPTAINGRICKDDVLGAMAQKAIGKRAAQSADINEGKEVPLSGMRKTIARRMSESWHTSPRVCYECEVDVTQMQMLRRRLKKEFEQKGQRLSYNHIIMMAVAKLLKKFQEINAYLREDVLVLQPHVNIGIAVGVENGLLVPNLKNCESMTLTNIAKGTEEMIARARAGKLDAGDLTGGTFTITNLGMFGMRRFSPIINQPELAILGVNAIVDKPVVVDGQVVIKPMMTLNLVADHRAIDGMYAANFLKSLVEFLETPGLMLV